VLVIREYVKRTVSAVADGAVCISEGVLLIKDCTMRYLKKFRFL